jgi:hypothetical protein
MEDATDRGLSGSKRSPPVTDLVSAEIWVSMLSRAEARVDVSKDSG